MNTWTVSCGSCEHRWNLVGSWSVYETTAIESRPCPCCGAYTLRSPEPRTGSRPRPKAWPGVVAEGAPARAAG